MELTSRVAQVLHQEHVAVISLMGNLESLVIGELPETIDSKTSLLLGNLFAAIEGEITNHFTFEEGDLFPLLTEEGDGDMADLLCEEHAVILPLGREVARRARNARSDGFTAQSWREFKRFGAEFAERLSSHAQKEELGLVPLLDETLDDDEDARLADRYESIQQQMTGTY